MIVWRVCREEYADLSGIGASFYGGRWNSQGRPVVYTSSSLSLAFLEILPGLRKRGVPKGFISLEIHIPEDLTRHEITLNYFPKGWEEGQADRWFIEKGDLWLADKTSAILSVPSVIIPQERNILLNPHHEDIQKINIISQQPFRPDPRLVQ